MKNKKINIAMMAGMILMSMGCEAKGKASQSSISGKYNVETLTTKGQTVKVAGQKCFEDSYFEIKGNIAYISLNNVVNGNCITKAGTYDMQSKGNGRYILVGNGKESDEIIVKNGKVQYNQDTGISMIFVKSQGTVATAKNTQNKGQTSKEVSSGGNVQATKAGRGVYAGVDHSGFDQVIYLRDDGTYTEELGKSDWKTRVDGTYIINGNKLITTDKKGVKDEYEYTSADKKTMLAPGSFYMFKAQIPKNKIPDGVYNFYVGSVSGSAGIGVSGAGGSGYIKFEGNRFTESSSSFSSMSTSSATGGSSSSSKASGTYTINNGDLTLKYNNGVVKKHSFFYIPPTSRGKGAMVILDGDIYYND